MVMNRGHGPNRWISGTGAAVIGPPPKSGCLQPKSSDAGLSSCRSAMPPSTASGKSGTNASISIEAGRELVMPGGTFSKPISIRAPARGATGGPGPFHARTGTLAGDPCPALLLCTPPLPPSTAQEHP